MQHFGDLQLRAQQFGWKFLGHKMISGAGFEKPDGTVAYYSQRDLQDELDIIEMELLESNS